MRQCGLMACLFYDAELKVQSTLHKLRVNLEDPNTGIPSITSGSHAAICEDKHLS
jgi:hypothetical protein